MFFSSEGMSLRSIMRWASFSVVSTSAVGLAFETEDMSFMSDLEYLWWSGYLRLISTS